MGLPCLVIAPVSTLAVLALAVAPVCADDWPEWRGPRRDGIAREQGWMDGWPAGAPPRVAWRFTVGKGHSAVAISQGRAYVMGWDGKEDTVFCLDAAGGQVIWKQSYPCKTILQWPGPRATPTVADGHVYVLGQHGQLRAYQAKDGTLAWSRQLPESYNPDVDYGFAWSPLVEGDLLILSAGKRGLAINRRDGGFAWGNDGQHGACASAVRYDHAGKRGVAIVTTNPGRDDVSLVGIDPRTGEELWRRGDWKEKWGAACVDPIVHDGKIFITTAEQHQRAARFTIKEGRLEEDWSNRAFACYTGGCVLTDGCLYGVTKNGVLKCLAWDTGKEQWAQRGFGEHGALIACDGKLIIQASRGGDLVVAEANPSRYVELRRARTFTGDPETFTPPVLANGRLYCRSYAGEVVCLDLTRP